VKDASRTARALVLLGLLTLCCRSPNQNRDPVIIELGGPSSVRASDLAEFWCGAVDPDSNSMTFTWTCSDGVLTPYSADGAVVHWRAPSASGLDTISVVVADELGGSADRSKVVVVHDSSATRVADSRGLSGHLAGRWLGHP
jgi:hypothetical protein